MPLRDANFDVKLGEALIACLYTTCHIRFEFVCDTAGLCTFITSTPVGLLLSFSSENDGDFLISGRHERGKIKFEH